MADAKTYVKRFFDSLFQCASELDNGWKKDDLKILFGDLEKLFSSDDVVETVQWKIMFYNIINSRVYFKMFIENEDESESSVEDAAIFHEFPDSESSVFSLRPSRQSVPFSNCYPDFQKIQWANDM